MGVLCSALGLHESSRDFVGTVGQSIVYDATKRWLIHYNEDVMAMARIFIGRISSDFKRRHKLPMGGMLQPRGRQARAAMQKQYGSYDVMAPLYDFGAAIGGDDVSLAYLTVQDWELNVLSIMNQNAARLKYEIMRPLLNATQQTFIDELKGTLTIDPLANGDAVLYPPIEGAEVAAIDNHFIESGYAASAISDTNNPIATAVAEIAEHFGGLQTGGSNFVTFINSAQKAKVMALTTFDEVHDRYIRQGDDTAIPQNLPDIPGEIIGRVSGSWVSAWDQVPANYIHTTHLEEEGPLHMRTDLEETGLTPGLQMVAKDENYPFHEWQWRNRYGIGPNNRLNGATIELGTGGTYTTPTGY